MTVQEIAMPVDEARTAYLHYRDAVRSTRTGTKQQWRKQDIALMRGYRALSKGKRVIDLNAVMHKVGLRPDFYPKLAIMRANATTCVVDMNRDGSATFKEDRWTRKKGINLPPDTFEQFTPVWMSSTTANRPRGWSERVETLVPMVPPQLRPPNDIAGYHILWEVDEWKPAPSRDPMLLKYLDGSLYVVLATWDLTPLEMAVLR